VLTMDLPLAFRIDREIGGRAVLVLGEEIRRHVSIGDPTRAIRHTARLVAFPCSVRVKFVEWKSPLQAGIKFKEILSERIGYLNEADLHSLHANYLPTKFRPKRLVACQRST
jgi:hypothetical protein